jgi:hypothetical protein
MFTSGEPKRFGSSSKKTPPEQGNLFDEVEITAEPELDDETTS